MASLGSIRYAATRPYRIQSLDDKVRLLNEDLTVHTTSEPVSPPLGTVGGAKAVRLAVVVGALGVVFGDIGTSPIYTLATVFNPSDPHPVPLNTDNIYGVVSLLFWSVMTIVTLTYVTLVMQDRKSTRLNSSHPVSSRMPSSA